MVHTYFIKSNSTLHLYLYKSSTATDSHLAYFKRKVLEALKASEEREHNAIVKSLLLMEKANYPVGTVRTWKGGKVFIKVAPGRWRPKYDAHTWGAKQSMRILQKKVAACTDAMQLMKLVEEHKQRFCDKDGNLYDWVHDLHNFAREQRYNILTAVNKDVEKRHAEAKARREAEEKDFGHDYIEYKGKGQEAVDFIAKNGAGQVRGAFNRKDTGDIDVVWGKVTDAKAHKGYGIAHLIDKHGKDALKHVGDVIENGKIIMSGVQRINIEKDGYVVGIRKDWKGHKKQWVVTSFQRNDGGNLSASAVTDYTKATSSQPSDASVPQSKEKSSGKSEIWKAKGYSYDYVHNNVRISPVEQLTDKELKAALVATCQVPFILDHYYDHEYMQKVKARGDRAMKKWWNDKFMLSANEGFYYGQKKEYWNELEKRGYEITLPDPGNLEYASLRFEKK